MTVKLRRVLYYLPESSSAMELITQIFQNNFPICYGPTHLCLFAIQYYNCSALDIQSQYLCPILTPHAPPDDVNSVSWDIARAYHCSRSFCTGCLLQVLPLVMNSFLK